jgi:hypothetical protein
MILPTRIAVMTLIVISALAAVGQQQPAASPAAAPDQSQSQPSQAQPPQPQPPQTQPPPPAQGQGQQSQAQPAQGQGQQPQAQPQSPANQERPLTSEEVLRQEEKQRALGIVPMFSMTSVHNPPPLSTSQKFRLMGRTMIDPFTFVSAGITAGLGQATNSFAQYGQGATGFAKRYGAAFADNADSNLMSNFVYSAMFKQDPRYFRLGEGPIKPRVWTAIEQEFVARKDSGGHTFSYENVLGAFTAGAISNIYYPSDNRGFGLTVGRAGTALGYGTLGNVLLEFWPDIDKKWFHRHSSQMSSNPPPNGELAK